MTTLEHRRCCLVAEIADEDGFFLLKTIMKQANE
jgi:hypothetical protein